MPAEILAAKASIFKLNGNCFTDVQMALENALHHARENDLILVCGSVFLVGEVDSARLKKNH
jgi:dihydrofolate synthase/folylpolyglutamate synthase